MALSLTGPGKEGGKNLICGVCREVYRSPRLLPCFHTFCLYCVEGLVRAQPDRQFFPCPKCRKAIIVPPQGALGFQLNFYITEAELEYERKEPSRVAMCATHDMEPLVFFCVPCDQAICIRCRLTKHSDHHDTQDLSEAAARCSEDLERSKERLESAISFLSKKSTGAQENLRAAKEKGVAIKQEVHRQHAYMVQKIRAVFTKVLDKIDQSNSALEGKLTLDAQSIQKDLDSVMQLRQSVHRALTTEASDAKKVFVAKNMREGDGSEASLQKIQTSIPAETSRPGLHLASDLISEEDILHVLGQPVTLSMPFETDCGEVLVPVFLDEKKSGQEVYWLCQEDSERIGVSVWDSSANKTTCFYINESGKCIYTDGVVSGKWSCKRYAERRYFSSSFQCSSEEGKVAFRLNSKGFHGVIFQVLHLLGEGTSVTRLEVLSHSPSPFKSKKHPIFDTRPAKPAAFDANSTGSMFVLVEETPQTGQPPKEKGTQRQVCLYRRGQSTPFATYVPRDAAFCPSDVCFWQENGQDRLLVADRQNDSVHVLSIHEDRVGFERYLAAGDSTLVRPTALTVDDRGRVWIGCQNGSVLKYERQGMRSKAAADNGTNVDDSSSVATDVEGSSVGSQLMVEKGSAQSQTSAT